MPCAAQVAAPAVPPAPVFVPPPPPPPPAQLAGKPDERPVRFENCDGFPAPTRRTDGITAQDGGWFGLRSQDGSRGATTFSASGIPVCTQVLQDPRLQPTHGLRRASLLQARALHRLTAGEPHTALADLELADRMIGPDAYGRRSVGINNGLIRSYAQLRADDRTAASATAAAVIAERPFEPGVTGTAARVRLAATGDWDAYLADLRQVARVNPNVIPLQFLLNFMRGDMAQAVALYPHIVLTTPRERGGFQIEGLLASRVETMVNQAHLHGAYAYALASIGQEERAAQELAAARARLDRQVAPPVPPPGRTRVSRTAQTEHNMFVAGAPAARRSLDRSERLIRLRGLIRRGDLAAFHADIRSGGALGADGASIELMRAAAQADAAEREGLQAAAAVGEQVVAQELAALREINMGKLIDELPEPETSERMPGFNSGSDSILSLDSNGYREHRSELAGARTIRYASQRGSLATAGELALLRAAQLARQGGHAGMIVLGRRSSRRSVQMYGMYSGGSISDAGQETELDVIFVDPARLPEGYADAGWRVIDVNAVWNALHPIYAAPAAPARRAR